LHVTVSRHLFGCILFNGGLPGSGRRNSAVILIHRLAVMCGQLARENRAKSGDKRIITGGVTNGKCGNTNLIKMEESDIAEAKRHVGAPTWRFA